MLFYNIISVYFLIMMIAVIYWAARINSLNGSAYARSSVLLCLAVCFYIFGYTMELNAGSESQILFWNHLEYLGIPFVSALWLTVGLLYTGHFSRHKKLLIAAIYLIPVITMILRFTNGWHHLYFSSEAFAEVQGKLLLVKKFGPWTYVQLVHSMLMIFVTLGLLIYDSFKSREKETGKINLMFASSFFAVSGLILALYKPFGLIIDYMALCLPISCLMVILAIFRYDFLETKCMARSKVFAAGMDAILLINKQKKIIDYNKSAKRLFSKIDIGLTDGYISTLFHHYPCLIKSLEQPETSIVNLKIDQKERYFEICTKDIGNSRLSHGQIKTVRDVTDTYERNERLKRQAMMDELSGLCNRRAFMQTGRKFLMESDHNGKTVHLLMMDLDHFKRVNDQYGHQMGDQVIQRFGEILKGSFSVNSVAARLGGEEFGVLLTGYSNAQIKRKADSFLRTVELQEYCFMNEKFHVTVSIGIAKKSYHTQTLDHMLQIADKALYISKNCGRDCVTIA